MCRPSAGSRSYCPRGLPPINRIGSMSCVWRVTSVGAGSFRLQSLTTSKSFHASPNLTLMRLITAVELPHTPFFSRSHYLKARDRASFEFALASAAVALDVHDGRIRAARVALGGIATKPWRSIEAERALVGAQAGQTAYAAAARVALQGAKPQKHNGFKIELARRVIIQALSTVTAM